MPLFPDPSGNPTGEGQLGPALKRSVPDSPSGKLFIKLVKIAHEVLRAVVRNDEKATDEATARLEAAIGELDMSDRDARITLMSIVMTLATSVPPSVYGGDNTLGGAL
jgi:hypothetical protein